ncbi:hypothetical protein [Chryseobacterium arthrosphaerae]|uniref:hypothetical protein n=1 Tax=Chryseobacterium arthrosphaerae TaxID=651561 RepID=UPI00241CC622|nr:hypothetical protein [Chryseobacterium arthrosphaerae]
MKIKITIQNCSNEKMTISKEPEALESFINSNDEIKVETNEQEENIYLNVGKNDDGTIYNQIWDAPNTEYTIYHKGENMFKEYL